MCSIVFSQFWRCNLSSFILLLGKERMLKHESVSLHIVGQIYYWTTSLVRNPPTLMEAGVTRRMEPKTTTTTKELVKWEKLQVCFQIYGPTGVILIQITQVLERKGTKMMGLYYNLKIREKRREIGGLNKRSAEWIWLSKILYKTQRTSKNFVLKYYVKWILLLLRY